MKKPFIAVIGQARSGKTTIILSLTGFNKRGKYGLVTNKANDKGIYVIAGSPQESDMTEATFKAILKKTVKDTSILGIVIAIQPTRPYRRLPLERILKLVKEADSLKPYAFIITPSYNSELKVAENPEVANLAERLETENVKNIRKLDGRKFSYLNAIEIQKMTGIVR